MTDAIHGFSMSCCLCLLLAACAAPAKKADVMDLYSLPVVNQGKSAYPMPVDNDSYYRQPSTYRGCGEINDAPSCGGG